MKLNVGLIGCGRIGRRHAEQIAKHGVLKAVCDINLSAGSEMAADYNAKFYDDAQAMVENEPDIDIVAICTPNGLHAEHAILSLKAGKHVLCEKPMCITTTDGRRMIAAAEAANKKLYVVKQNRYNPPVVAVKKLLKEDRLGKILSFQVNCFWNRPNSYYYNSWRGTRDMDGGTLFTQFSHFIDVLYWFLGDVQHVQAMTKNYEHRMIEIEDCGVVILKMRNGAVGTFNYTVNSHQKNMEGSITLFGEKGTVKIGGQYLNELEYQCISGYKIEDLPQGGIANNYGFYQGSMSNHDKVYQHLEQALNDPAFEYATHLDGLKTVEIIEMIYAAASKRLS